MEAASSNMAPSSARPNGPQPIIDSLDASREQIDDAANAQQRPNTAPRPDPSSSLVLPQPTETGSTSRDLLRRPSPRRNGSMDTRPLLARAKSDFGPRREDRPKAEDAESRASGEAEWGIRHGFETQLTSEDHNNLLTANFFMYFTDKRHETGGLPKAEENYKLDWRMKDRLKTVAAVLALCLNIGVDPPDVIKTSPCAKMECWIDPTQSTSSQGSGPINLIGKQLQTQYEQLSLRTRYKLSLDPTVEEAKRYWGNLRKNARNERVLLHYNGHGVPRPTGSGEIWVFNRTYTQYIPISIYDMQSWVTAPSLFVYDCSDAGLIIKNFNRFAEKHESENVEARQRDPQAEVVDFSDCIHLAACAEKESLPTNPDLPADVFTSCLTTPIEMAIRFFILQNPLRSAVTLSDAQNIPGRVSERRTPIGELNWIFTAITDTIAWNSLPGPLFKKLFRQDLMVAALFRNFLLAQRIMRVYHCHPQCHPEIPQTHSHELWKSWDLAVEMILAQLPDLLAAERGEKTYEYQHSNFFAEQLTAFEVYLQQGAIEQKQPEQLPIVLQVLLSQVHRLRALILLSRFLDLGPWAVELALSIGIFPYVLKLLSSQAIELKPVMIFIWARILAVDGSCQSDLLKESGFNYFISILNPSSGVPVGNVSEHRAMCAFIIAMFCKDFHQGRTVSLSSQLIESCLGHLEDLQNPLLRQWSCLCLSMLWVDFADAKWEGIRRHAHQRLCDLVVDPVAEVRAAMLHALTSFLGIEHLTPQILQYEESIASMVLIMASDGNSMVRNELLVFFSTFVARYQNRFVVAAYEQLKEEKEAMTRTSEQEVEKKFDGVSSKPRSLASSDESSRTIADNTVYSAVWKEILIMSVDPHPAISENACVIVDYVLEALVQSPLSPLVLPIMDFMVHNKSAGPFPSRQPHSDLGAPSSQPSRPSTPPTPNREGYLSLGLKRTASIAASLFSFGDAPPSHNDSPPKVPARASTFNDQRLAVRSKLPDGWQSEKESHTPAQSLQLGPNRVPPPKYFKRRNANETAQIPLKSKFFDWSVEYFREPQMKPSEADEPGSTDYNQRLWRRNRNDRIIAKTQPQKEVAGSNKWDKAKAFFNAGMQPMKLCFHQFEEQIVVTDDTHNIGIFDWKHKVPINRFSNGNPTGSKITEVRLINEDDQALLMTGSSDGVLKLFRHYESPSSAELVTAFRALTDLVPSNKNAGLVFDWQQSRGLILVAGDVKVIRVWNAGTEICTADIPARSGSCITSLTSDQVEGHIFVASFGDGAVRVYDQREKPATAMVRVWKEHKQWITNVHLQRGGQRELVTGCRSGEVKLWDMRSDKSLRTIATTKRDETLKCLSVHEHAPVFAVGTSRHTVKLFNTSTSQSLSEFEPYSSFLGQGRSKPIASTAFHPHRMMIAGTAVGDSHVLIHACNKEEAAPPNPFGGDGIVQEWDALV
ncbi:WD repeat-containing protein-like protein mip1 [Aulographum hederae CBS 113979]|uniref:WD repeat-containing protein-like protein mip1 n=1 Tax=Aulographum hederae CBS 113979 TaxID=1176131 RepID=A0A6G1GSU8_9PEZI|nr:WD repeat-containing protein-like protein mip1 [Aulographum hederae CBS 113979]